MGIGSLTHVINIKGRNTYPPSYVVALYTFSHRPDHVLRSEKFPVSFFSFHFFFFSFIFFNLLRDCLKTVSGCDHASPAAVGSTNVDVSHRRARAALHAHKSRAARYTRTSSVSRAEESRSKNPPLFHRNGRRFLVVVVVVPFGSDTRAQERSLGNHFGWLDSSFFLFSLLVRILKKKEKKKNKQNIYIYIYIQLFLFSFHFARLCRFRKKGRDGIERKPT